MKKKVENKSKKKNKGGRPKIEVSYDMIKKLASIFCTGEEIADILEISYDTLERRIKSKYKCSFADYIKKYNNTGKASLRRMQFKSAEAGNATLQVWLGKQYLGQTDKQEIDYTEKKIIIPDELK